MSKNHSNKMSQQRKKEDRGRNRLWRVKKRIYNYEIRFWSYKK